MKKKIENMYSSWKTKGYKREQKDKAHMRKDTQKFVEAHDNKLIGHALNNEFKPNKEDLILGLEIKYLDWLRGIW